MSKQGKRTRRTEAAEASKTAILDAAEALFFDFFVTHPTFIRITEWEAFNGGRYLGNLPRLVMTLREAVQVLQEEARWHIDAEQFLIDLVALCWFPLAPADTFLKPLGVDIGDPDFLARRKQHVVQFLLEGNRPHLTPHSSMQ